MLFFKIRMREAPKYLHNILPDPTSRSGYNFPQEFLPGAYSQSDIDSYFLLATSNNSVEWITS